MNTIKGVMKFFDSKKGYGSAVTPVGGIFVHKTSVPAHLLDLMGEGARVELAFETAYKDGQYRKKASSVIKVMEAPRPVEVLDVVDWYEPKRNFGFIHCGSEFPGQRALLHGGVCAKAGVIPGAGMPMRALVTERFDKNDELKLFVISFKWGDEVEAEYRKMLAEQHHDDIVGESAESTAVSADNADTTEPTPPAEGFAPEKPRAKKRRAKKATASAAGGTKKADAKAKTRAKKAKKSAAAKSEGTEVPTRGGAASKPFNPIVGLDAWARQNGMDGVQTAS